MHETGRFVSAEATTSPFDNVETETRGSRDVNGREERSLQCGVQGSIDDVGKSVDTGEEEHFGKRDCAANCKVLQCSFKFEMWQPLEGEDIETFEDLEET